jgi:hypothetical protein
MNVKENDSHVAKEALNKAALVVDSFWVKYFSWWWWIWGIPLWQYDIATDLALKAANNYILSKNCELSCLSSLNSQIMTQARLSLFLRHIRSLLFILNKENCIFRLRFVNKNQMI